MFPLNLVEIKKINRTYLNFSKYDRCFHLHIGTTDTENQQTITADSQLIHKN